VYTFVYVKLVLGRDRGCPIISGVARDALLAGAIISAWRVDDEGKERYEEILSR
jgi:hypothetical protein